MKATNRPSPGSHFWDPYAHTIGTSGHSGYSMSSQMRQSVEDQIRAAYEQQQEAEKAEKLKIFKSKDARVREEILKRCLEENVINSINEINSVKMHNHQLDQLQRQYYGNDYNRYNFSTDDFQRPTPPITVKGLTYEELTKAHLDQLVEDNLTG